MPTLLTNLVAVSRRIRRPLERQVKSQGSGIWRSTEDGNRIFIDNAGEVRAGGPAGPILKEGTKKKPAKPRVPRTPKPRTKKPPEVEVPTSPTQTEANDSKLSNDGDVAKKKRRSREPKAKLDDVISEYIDSKDKNIIAAFKIYVDKAHAMLGEQRNGDRYALQEVLAQFGFKGSKASGWVGALRFKKDYTEIPGFDQMAEYTAKYHPELLASGTGESLSGEDSENAFFTRLQQGFPYAPGKDSEEVLDQAAAMAGPAFFAEAAMADGGGEGDGDDDEMESVYDPKSGFWVEQRVSKDKQEELEDAPF